MRGSERFRIRLNGVQGVGHVLKRGEYGAFVLGGSLNQRILRPLFSGAQRATVENRHCNVADQVEKPPSRLKHLAWNGSFSPEHAGNGKLRKPIRQSHSDLRVGCMHLLLCSPDIGSLLHQSGRNGEGQFLRQVQR